MRSGQAGEEGGEILTEVLSPGHLRQLNTPAVHDEVPDTAHQPGRGGGGPHLGRVGGGLGRQPTQVQRGHQIQLLRLP